MHRGPSDLSEVCLALRAVGSSVPASRGSAALDRPVGARRHGSATGPQPSRIVSSSVPDGGEVAFQVGPLVGGELVPESSVELHEDGDARRSGRRENPSRLIGDELELPRTRREAVRASPRWSGSGARAPRRCRSRRRRGPPTRKARPVDPWVVSPWSCEQHAPLVDEAAVGRRPPAWRLPTASPPVGPSSRGREQRGGVESSRAGVRFHEHPIVEAAERALDRHCPRAGGAVEWCSTATRMRRGPDVARAVRDQGRLSGQRRGHAYSTAAIRSSCVGRHARVTDVDTRDGPGSTPCGGAAVARSGSCCLRARAPAVARSVPPGPCIRLSRSMRARLWVLTDQRGPDPVESPVREAGHHTRPLHLNQRPREHPKRAGASDLPNVRLGAPGPTATGAAAAGGALPVRRPIPVGTEVADQVAGDPGARWGRRRRDRRG